MLTLLKKRYNNTLLLFLLFLFFQACGGGDSSPFFSKSDTEQDSLLLQESSSDYQRLGLNPNQVEVWEDALRTDPNDNTFEWWYFDYTFEDNTTVVLTFYTKFLFSTQSGASPMVTIQIVLPDGTKKEDYYLQASHELNASKTIPQVTIDNSFFRYEEGKYIVHYQHNDIEFNATMHSLVPMWRPKTGFICFQESPREYFAWLVAQPAAKTKATLHLKEQNLTLLGEGYHDHNWGKGAMYKNLDNWYWGRAKVGEHYVIFSNIVTQKKHHYQNIPLLMLAQKDHILSSDTPIYVIQKELERHPLTGKNYANTLLFSQQIATTNYSLLIERTKDLAFIDLNLLPLQMGSDPTYLRSLAKISLTTTDTEQNRTLHKASGYGIVEQFSFEKELHNPSTPNRYQQERLKNNSLEGTFQ